MSCSFFHWLPLVDSITNRSPSQLLVTILNQKLNGAAEADASSST